MLAEAKVVETVRVITDDAQLRAQDGAYRQAPFEQADRTNWPNLTERAGYLWVKTAAEWLIAFTLMAITAPITIILIVLVKLTSRGPAIYTQTRLGRFGRAYRIFKIRTMVHNAEEGTGPVWSTRDDARVTRLGRFLRSTHLDELPQLWNVLRGEMSLIGPRPERPEIARRIERRVPEFRKRLLVRPGITGLAQMLVGADDPDDVEYRQLKIKLAHDLYYVRKVGFLLDLRVAVSTPCFFLAAAIDSLRRGLVRSYGRTIQSDVEGHLKGPEGVEGAGAA
jgi:lipopolysaccharide/colanic/teichoic acid biosynthesis glycosyltransferase